MADMPSSGSGAPPRYQRPPPPRSPQRPRSSTNGSATNLREMPKRDVFSSVKKRDSMGSKDEEELEDMRNAAVGAGSLNMEQDYYSLLGVPKDATGHQIRSAYLRLSLSSHPDKQPPELKEIAESHFGKIVRAYEVLSDEKKRYVYDTLGEQGLQNEWALGPKNISHEQFKSWLEEQVRRGKQDLVEGLVRNRGEVVVRTMIPSLFFDQEQHQQQGIVLPNTPEVTKVTMRHHFKMGLNSLQSIFDAPLTLRREETTEEQLCPREHSNVPELQFNTDVSLDPHGRYKPSYGIGFDIEHEFPRLNQRPKHPTISSLLQGVHFRAMTSVLPHRNFGISLTRPIDITSVTLTTTASQNFKMIPPSFALQLTRPISPRTNLILNGNLAPLWPGFLRKYGFGLPPPKRGQGKYQMGSAFVLGFNIQPKTVYSAAQSKRTGKPVLKPERSGEKINIVFTSSTTELVGFRMDYARAFFPFGIRPEDSISTNLADAGKPKPATRGIEAAAHFSCTPAITEDGNLVVMPAFGISFTHRITRFTRVGFGYQVTPGAGVVFTLNWSRLGQSFVVPTTIGVAPSLNNIAACFGVPFAAYAAMEFIYLRPRARREQRRIFRSHLASIKTYLEQSRQRASEEIALMREQVEARQEREKAQGGLVIVYAEYGVPQLRGEIARLLAKVDESIVGGSVKRVMVDVTLPVANLVSGGQVVVGKKVKKANIVGFYDPVPFERKKVLKVRYMFQQRLHEVTVREDEALILPLREHAIEQIPIKK